MERRTQFTVWYVVIAVIGVFWLRDLWVTATQVEPIPYSEFQQQLKAGGIGEIAISDNIIQGTYKTPTSDGRKRFVTTRVDPELAKDLSQYDVKYSGIIQS